MIKPIWVLLPLVLLGGGALLVHLVARFISRRNEVIACTAAFVFGLSLAAALRLGVAVHQGIYPAWAIQGSPLPTMQWDPGALFLAIIVLVLGLLVALFSARYMSRDKRCEVFYPLLLALASGLLGMLVSMDLFTIFMFTMLTSTSAYLLVAFRLSTEAAIEAGFKYAVMGGFGAMLLLAGIGYLYRETGVLQLPFALIPVGKWGRVGMGLVVAGYGIKAALVPAHTWLPDAHGQAPSGVSALLSGIVIQVNLYVLIKNGLGIGWSPQWLGWLLIVAAILSMVVGNALCLVQTHCKRLLGYSTIAQMGYVMMVLGVGLVYQQAAVLAAGFFLIAAHALAKAGAFLCQGVCHFYDNAVLVDDLRGLMKRAPLVAGMFIVSVAGLVGIPPVVGFTAKWQALTTMLVQAEAVVWALVFVFVCANLASLVYYLRVFRIILQRMPETKPFGSSRWMSWPTMFLSVIIVVLGIFPRIILDLAQQAGAFLLTWGH